MLSITMVLLIIALVCFLIAAIYKGPQPVAFGWLGLAFWVASLLIRV